MQDCDRAPAPHLLTWQISDELFSAGYVARCLRCGRPVRNVQDWLETACAPAPVDEAARA